MFFVYSKNRGQASLLKRSLSLLALMSLAFVSFPALQAETAVADTFTAPEGPPDLTPPSISKASAGVFESFQPMYPRSTEVYTVQTTVSKPGGIGLLDNGVSMCLWLDSEADCAGADPDPQTTFIVDWNWTADANRDDVSVRGSNNYSADATRSTYTAADYTNDVNTTTLSFIFQVSNAMQNSFNWNLLITADDGSSTATVSRENLRTSYFGSIQTQRSSVAFPVSENDSTTVNSIPMGNYSANAFSEITLEATDFSRVINGNVKTLPISRSNVPSNLLSLSCSPNSSFDDADSGNKVLDESPQVFKTVSLMPPENREGPEAIGMHACKLNYRGIAANPNVSFTNTVTVGIGAGDYNAPSSITLDGTTTTSASFSWGEPTIVSGGSATIEDYVIEISTDGGNSWSFVSRTTQRSYSAASLSERATYDFRVTANTSVGSGSLTVEAETNSNAGASLQTLQALNSSLSGFTESSDATNVIAAIEAEGLTVFAAPTYGNLAERMYEENSGGASLDRKGYFREDLFENPTELARLGGFSGNLDNAPFIGFVGFGNNTFHGSAIMGFTSDADGTITNTSGSEDTVYLSDLFQNDTTAKTFGTYVLNSNGTTVDNSSTNSRTKWSDGLSYSSDPLCETYSRFSCDDIVLGFTAGSTSILDGNGGAYLLNNSNSSYGVENRNSSDYRKTYFWGQSYSDTDYVFYFFIAEAP